MMLEKIKIRRSYRLEIIKERNKFKSETGCKSFDRDDISLLLGECIDDYLEHRIQSDKVLEGILKDIQGSIDNLASRHWASKR